jgi:hypothetical protein
MTNVLGEPLAAQHGLEIQPCAAKKCLKNELKIASDFYGFDQGLSQPLRATQNIYAIVA